MKYGFLTLPEQAVQRGMMTVMLLMILSGLLFSWLLFEEKLHQLYAVQTSYHKHSLKQHKQLLRQVQSQHQSACEALPLTQKGYLYRFRFLSHLEAGEIEQAIWCRRIGLFHTAPRRGINQRPLTQFMNMAELAHFSSLFSDQEAMWHTHKTPQFYWFSAPQHTLTLQGNLNAVIIAEGDLVLQGKGKITGAIIVAGQFQQAESVTVSYRKSTLDHWLTTLSRWQKAEKSWHDFIP